MTDFIQPLPYKPPPWVTKDAKEAASSFWAARNEEYAEAEAARPPKLDVHARHAKMPMGKLAATCEPCWKRKLGWMLAQPRGTHVRRHGERLAGIAEGAGGTRWITHSCVLFADTFQGGTPST